MIRFDVITIFPEVFGGYLQESILRRAAENGLIKVKVHDLRRFVRDKHRTVDDKPYGGGPGMVLMAPPIIRAIRSLRLPKNKSRIIIFSASGRQLDASGVVRFSKYQRIVMVAGRYEGIDERVREILSKEYRVEEVSIGPYVLTGGELPAMVMIDAVARHLPGVLGKKESLEERRYGVGVPVYTRPEEIVLKSKKYTAPEVLTSGDHKKVEERRRRQTSKSSM